MTDTFSKPKRSSIMRSVKSTKNLSTELRLISLMKEFGIKGWRRNYSIIGKPDFVFRKNRIALFVDGCFWHGHNCRNLKPSSNKNYWEQKIARNKGRDILVNSILHQKGWSVMRIWECSLKNEKTYLGFLKKLKRSILLLLFLSMLLSCSKKDEKFELFSAEAFAYSMDSGWELNSSCRTKGFRQIEETGNFKAKLSFTADLTTPDGKIIFKVGEGLVNQSSKEKFSDLPIETQIQLDSTYKTGKYFLTFNVSDKLSGKSTSIKKEFVLE